MRKVKEGDAVAAVLELVRGMERKEAREVRDNERKGQRKAASSRSNR